MPYLQFINLLSGHNLTMVIFYMIEKKIKKSKIQSMSEKKLAQYKKLQEKTLWGVRFTFTC